jgi:neurofibromin 1
MNLLQSLYVSRTEEDRADLLQLITECTHPTTLSLFGLRRDTPTSEYANVDPASDKDTLDIQERLVDFLVRILEVTSGSKGMLKLLPFHTSLTYYLLGLLNVWRARWMSLVTSTAFQVSPAVQTRSFVALGTLATTDVDDDFLYQILVAFNTALGKANESHTMSVVSMLRCMCKIVPALSEGSRYVPLLFWLAVSLLQASHLAFYVESTRLVRVTLETMEKRGMFKNEAVHSVLLESRIQLEEITSQLDEILKISFESSFSFSLASIIFKGIRHSGLKDSAEAVLRSLLSVTVRSQANDDLPSGFRDSISADALGYFLALLPLSATPASYRRLLDHCNVDDAWLPDAGLETVDDDEHKAPRISPAFLGISDSSTALLVTTFVGTMLITAQGDDTETEILCSLLSDIANSFPQTVAMACVSMVTLFCHFLNAYFYVSVMKVYKIESRTRSQTHRTRPSFDLPRTSSALRYKKILDQVC